MKTLAKRGRPASGLRSIFLCLAFLLSGICILAVLAEASSQVIRVGRFPYDDQWQRNEQGTYSGYGIEYLQKIARYAHWRYEFVDAPWSECLAMLERGEIDLLGAVMRSPEREAKLDFSSYPMISGYGVLATPLDNSLLSYEDFAAFDGLDVGVLKGNLHAANFMAYCREHGVMPRIHDYDTEAEMNKALRSGEISAVIMTNLLRSPFFRVIATFGENDAYFATSKGNTRVLQELNEAMRQIRLNEPYFNSRLDQKHSYLQASSNISFTREELDFIRNSPPVPSARILDDFPISYGSVAVEICRLLEKRTGLSFVWWHPSSESEADAMLREGKILLLPAKIDDFNWEERNQAVFTEPYLQDQMLMVANRAFGNHTENVDPAMTVALYDSTLKHRLASILGEGSAQFVDYDTVADCMDAVLAGKADATFLSSSVVFALMSNPKYAHLQTSPLYGTSADIAMALQKDTDPLLLTILNKGLRSISPVEINQIVLGQLKRAQSGTLASFLYLHPVEILLLVGFVSLALIIALSVLFHNRLKNARQLARILYTDTLTGHPNYRALLEGFNALVGRNPEQYAVVYMDIHRFKVINDTFGYEAGDHVLTLTSNLLTQFVKPDERFARVYADIFVLLLHHESQDTLKERLTGLTLYLDQLFTQSEKAIKPLFCGGVYPLANEFTNLEKACDRANYAKDSISHRFSSSFVFYDDIMRNRALKEKELEDSMLSALDRHEFVPFYQPKINVLTEKVVGAEALVRWAHPEKGYLLPADFIPFYEKNGFIVNIDLSLFEQVCRDLRSLLDKGKPVVPISVNFSRRHMLNSGLPKALQNIVNTYGISAQLLDIEITETEELENVEMAVDFVKALKSYGFAVSIDDYGTGYSSLSFLQNLPLDTLKLDRTFILNAMKSPKAEDVMRYLVAAMQKNGIQIVCEGIETEAQRDFALALGCRIIQGYLYSRPLPHKEFELYLTHKGSETACAKPDMPLGLLPKKID